MPAKKDEQIGLEDKFVEDSALEQALEGREEKREAKATATKAYKEKNAAAQELIAKHELDGTAVRVGRFRLHQESAAARTVSFTTEPKKRVIIETVE